MSEPATLPGLSLPAPLAMVVDVIRAAADPSYVASAQGVPEPVLLSMGRRHNLLPLMHSLHREGRLRLAASAAKQLHPMALAQTALVMQLEHTLAAVGAGLDERGVRFLLFKGAALAGTIYPQPAWRPFVDLDLLIDREKYDLVEPMLLQMGMVPSTRMSVRRRLRYFNSVEFHDAARPQVQIDLHWSDVSASWSDGSILTGEQVWEQAGRTEIAGRACRILSPAHSLVHLCGHWGYHHQFTSLISLLDLLLLNARMDESGVRRARELAAECAYRRVLALSMLLAGVLSGSPDPRWADEEALDRRRQERMLRLIEVFYRCGGVWRGRRIKALCLDSRRARRRALVAFLASRLHR
ncbi:MAG: hypothetical protein BIFFINMI_03914 [Phycisphaerae bacterium]|nr:hypothetical protein [Phycisphaerae bacterium]